MAVPIILLYGFGILFFILSIEDEREMTGVLYVAISIFFNIIAYYISYSNPDYVALAYIPLALLIVSVMIFIYRVYGYLPKDSDWGDEHEEEYKYRKDIT